MTDKEKAKAYDEALDRMKYVVVVPKDKKALQALKETIFPELAESEDERIRKEIIDHLVREVGLYPGVDRKEHKWLRWLEKQKEQKPSTEETELNSIAFLEQMGYTCIPPRAKPAEYLDKDKVYAIMKKLTSLSFCIPLGSDEEKQIHEITSDVRSLLDYPIEQKPAEWSEEDEKMLKRAIGLATRYSHGPHDEMDDGIYYSELLDWLKSLHPQPKQEWSEEDERIVRFYEADYNNQIGDMSMKDVINMRLEFKNWLVNRLKDIRPSDEEIKKAYTKGFNDAAFGGKDWKPSEEQMEALSDAYVEASTFKKAEILESLYNDLKKL